VRRIARITRVERAAAEQGNPHGREVILAGNSKLRVADCFVCFSGVIERPEVMERAHVVVRGPSAKELLPALCSPTELQTLSRDPRHGKLVTPAL
jgi:hypothetical protein